MPPVIRLRTILRGAVQGVGFRPFVFRLATELGLSGWVSNSSEGVVLEAEGPPAILEQFLVRLEREKPAPSFIQSLEPAWLDPVGYQLFEIRPSHEGGPRTALVLPDLATCPDCLREILEPANRRYGYPFTNCTHCGPRFSIIEALPYDRANTSMKIFAMCRQCRTEYEDPHDRRFHAQPNACPACGPHLALWDSQGKPLPDLATIKTAGAPDSAVLQAAAEAIRQGRIVAVKGLGGFQLMVAAHLEPAVQRLRRLKRREEKPFALMFPSLAAIRAVCQVGPLEERLLRSPECPIVLLRRRSAGLHADVPAALDLAESIAPGNPCVGAMLPYTPLHHLLLGILGFAVVATSGNLSDEPICIDEHEALERLAGIADLFLVHPRPIVRHVDDSVVRIMAGRELVLRRARGYAPLPLRLAGAADSAPNILAVGGHLKNSVALAVGPQVFLSQHIGDLETEQASTAFRRVVTDFQRLYEATPNIVVADAHPDYLSTQFAREWSTRPLNPTDQHGNQPPQFIQVQHHLAHVLACMAENQLEPPVLGVAWDGTGYGLDGTIWGGEFFLVLQDRWERCVRLRPFRLPGGEKAIKEPCRTALGLLYAGLGADAFARGDLAPVSAFGPKELSLLRSMLQQSLNSPLTSSVGRLFDAVASLTGLRQRVRFEGQAAMELEFALEGASEQHSYPLLLSLQSGPPATLDWHPLLLVLLQDLHDRVPLPLVSARFHNGLVEAIVSVARQQGQPKVLLSGGCFQNRYLTERAIDRLRAEGFRPYWHQRVPPNDGGLALGQVKAAVSFKAATGVW